MIAADDARHGSTAGHNAGCRCAPCAAAKLAYDKRRKFDVASRRERRTLAVGTARRIRALQALGYSVEQIGDAAGLSYRTLHGVTNKNLEHVYVRTAEAVVVAYERLSMRLPEGRYAVRARNTSRRLGYAPPLAWDDREIDDPAATPRGNASGKRGIDPVVVDRLLAGIRIDSTAAEKNEAMRRWVASGGTRRQLALIHGWNDGRYGKGQEVAS